jgi:hypothetical protein
MDASGSQANDSRWGRPAPRPKVNSLFGAVCHIVVGGAEAMLGSS